VLKRLSLYYAGKPGNRVGRRCRDTSNQLTMPNGGLSSFRNFLRRVQRKIRSLSATLFSNKPKPEGIELPILRKLRRIEPRGRIAVVLCLYHADIWGAVCELINNVDQDFDLFVALVSRTSDVAEAVRRAFPFAYILTMGKRGYSPLLHLVQAGLLFKYDLVCVVDGRRAQRNDGGNLGKPQTIGILDSREVVHQIVSAFSTDPDLGMVVGEGQVSSSRTVSSKDFWIRPFPLRLLGSQGTHFGDRAVARRLAATCSDAGMKIADTANLPRPQSGPSSPIKLHVIANYLPQFHPVPENDEWWEPGFTEWTNVVRAKPQFKGHRQPRLPADLGFYDLRVAEVRDAQARLAAQYGVTSFSYYYYWFNGRRILERPLDEVLASGQPDFPFMLCWANEPWTRNWDGQADEILLPQTYEPGWEAAFVTDIAPALADPRYLRLNGKPVLAIYRVMHIPNPSDAIERIRRGLAEKGFSPVSIIAVWPSYGPDPPLPQKPQDLGLDAYFEFPPCGLAGKFPWKDELPGRSLDFGGYVDDYRAIVDAVINGFAEKLTARRYRGVMTGWDNTARRGARGSWIYHGATPANFRRWLRATVLQARAEAWAPETAVFINAWNEWAEGTYLEPDRDFGHGWLEAVASATAEDQPPDCSFGRR